MQRRRARYHSYAKRPNRCSILGTVPGSNGTGNLFNIVISFTDICSAHDRCHYTLGTTPRACDMAFEVNLRRHCDAEIKARVRDGWHMMTAGTSTATAQETCYTNGDVT